MASKIPKNRQEQIRREAQNRCGYCQANQAYIPWPLEIEHIIPRAKGGTDEVSNLWLACRSCNSFKGAQTHGRDPVTGRQVALFNPRQQNWYHHFRWSKEGTVIIAQTGCGRATVLALNLNNLIAMTVRRNWVKAGWHPPRAIE
jgi:hypothetical protein